MSVTLGSYTFHDMIGPPPKVREKATVIHSRPGTSGVGGRVQPITGKSVEITLVKFVEDSSRMTETYSYHAAIGTVVDFIHKGVTYSSGLSTKFMVEAVDVIESKTIVRAVGHLAGTPFNYAPAGKVVSRWRLVPVAPS